MFSSYQFLITAAAVLSIQLAVIVLLYNISRIRWAASAGVPSTRFGTLTGKSVTCLLPLAIVIALIGDFSALKAYSDYDQKRIAKEERAVAYEPIIRAALSAKPDLWCLPNGYLIDGEANPISKRPCAQVGQFRVLDQYIGMSAMLEIYKVSDDGTVRAAAYQDDYDIGFVADEQVTSLAELQTAFGVK
jgi:hypothetical protein